MLMGCLLGDERVLIITDSVLAGHQSSGPIREGTWLNSGSPVSGLETVRVRHVGHRLILVDVTVLAAC